ncbi:hypothetical protein [Mesorhizobium sp.]|uniref:hypothetical protein n=1 Tax=Mesorhizobium sp. TaxID=1871066 RepID=UPI000FE8EF45|nr:hypothetical protein [Mesorhizobium sp.]RWP68167.1 MAG: hypothetical protein EOR07_08100 [Mesorhizobium sp.]
MVLASTLRFVVLTLACIGAGTVYAQDARLHAFVNDDDSQFVDIWLNQSGTVTIKASNGKPNRYMSIRVIVYFFSGARVVSKEYQNINCVAPNGYGPGKECWFENMTGPGITGITKISAESHKQS